MILLIGAGRDAVYAGGVRENLIFGNERGGGILGDHVSVIETLHGRQEAVHAA